MTRSGRRKSACENLGLSREDTILDGARSERFKWEKPNSPASTGLWL
jgi:hypothetical protein